MSLRTWLIRLLGGEPTGSSDRSGSNRGVTTATVSTSPKEDAIDVFADEEVLGTLSLTTEQDQLLLITDDQVSFYPLAGKGVNVVYQNDELSATDASQIISSGNSQLGEQLLSLPLGEQYYYAISFHQASASFIISSIESEISGPFSTNNQTESKCSQHLITVQDRPINISRSKSAIVIREVS